MTLSEFKSKCYSMPGTVEPTMLYVFADEDSADSWIESKYLGKDSTDYNLLAVIQSDFVVDYTMKSRWCKAEVQQFYAVAPDTVVVVIKEGDNE